MAVNRDMKPWMLQRNDEIHTPSGASRENWVDVEIIMTAVYEKNEMRATSNVRYQEATNTGLTYYKDFNRKKEYRLAKDGRCLRIIACNTGNRLSNLFLKEVDSYGGQQ